MLIRRSLLLILAGVLAAAGTANLFAGDAADARRLLREVEGSEIFEKNLRVLCNEIGGRLPGTGAMSRAEQWALEAFREAGVGEVRLEPFPVPESWQEGDTEAEVTAPVRFAVRAAATAWSPATPAGGVEAKVVEAGGGSPGPGPQPGERARGKIVLVRSALAESFADLGEFHRRAVVALREAAEAGAAAVVFMSNRPAGLLYRHINTLDGRIGKLPNAVLAREPALRISRLLKAGKPVRMRLSLPNKTGGPFTAHNVAAEIRGRARPRESVVVGAHLDSWDLGTGCLDNGGNAALVIEIARGLAAAGLRPRRTVKFVLFGAEEQGLLGSRAYVRRHRDELDSISAVIIHDMGAGRIKGYSLGGRRDLEAGLAEAMAPAARQRTFVHSANAFFGTDHFDFWLEGVPTLLAIQDLSNYVPYYHSSADTFDKIDLPLLRRQAGVAAVTVFNIADLPQRLGRRLNRQEVEGLLDRTGLDEQLRFLGLWDEFESGRRGRAKRW